MAKASPVSVAFHEGFQADMWPLLHRIGLVPTKPRDVKPGLVVARATRPLEGGRRLEVCLWCNGGTGDLLRLRVDIVACVDGVECSSQMNLRIPWTDESAPHPATLDFSGNEFLPGQSLEQLRKAIAFLAGGFAASVEEIVIAVPELADDLRTAATEPTWVRARARAAELWRTRHVRGEVDERRVAASIVFVGERLVTVDADGQRHTFRFDTKTFDRNAAVTVSGFVLTPAATSKATRLTSGTTTWQFDASGSLVQVSGAKQPE
jgi:hypothetical protein